MTQQAVMVRVSQAQSAFGVHRSTIYRWANGGAFKIHKRGTMSFVDPNDVRDFIKGAGAEWGADNAKAEVS